MEQRTQQWTAIWGQRQENHKVTSLPAMIDKGKEHAAKMKPIEDKELWRTIKLLSNKAPGLDGVGFDFLKALPYTAMKELAAFFYQVERPIALVATPYGTRKNGRVSLKMNIHASERSQGQSACRLHSKEHSSPSTIMPSRRWWCLSSWTCPASTTGSTSRNWLKDG